MFNINPQYITDSSGKKVSVILPIKEFQSLIEDLEELEDIRLYDKAKKNKTEFTDAEQAFKKIEK
jgi:hypothetical protein